MKAEKKRKTFNYGNDIKERNLNLTRFFFHRFHNSWMYEAAWMNVNVTRRRRKSKETGRRYKECAKCGRKMICQKDYCLRLNKSQKRGKEDIFALVCLILFTKLSFHKETAEPQAGNIMKIFYKIQKKKDRVSSLPSQ